MSFNSRTREGCDKFVSKLILSTLVSIHAPVKDATIAYLTSAGVDAVSIHAPVKDATARGVADLWNFGFNSRTREGCDVKGT